MLCAMHRIIVYYVLVIAGLWPKMQRLVMRKSTSFSEKWVSFRLWILQYAHEFSHRKFMKILNSRTRTCTPTLSWDKASGSVNTPSISSQYQVRLLQLLKKKCDRVGKPLSDCSTINDSGTCVIEIWRKYSWKSTNNL